MDVTIVIVSYNVANFLNDCLYSIKKETRCSYEVIVVDNYSEDNTVEIVQNQHPDIKLIKNQRNEGFAKANNRGFKIAKGRYILMLNPDTVILDKAIDKLVRFMDTHPKAGACGPKNFYPDLSLQHNCHHFPSLVMTFFECLQLRRFFPKKRLFGREQMTYWTYDEVRDVDWITGCSLMIRKTALDGVGFLDENYFIYSEECDFCYRLKQKKWKILFFPGASIIHYYGQSSSAQNPHKAKAKTATRYYFESRYYFFKKNFGRGREFLLRLIDIIYYSLSFLRNKIMLWKGDREERMRYAEIVLHAATHISSGHRT
jgi:GT2 family glycosyltransferase